MKTDDKDERFKILRGKAHKESSSRKEQINEEEKDNQTDPSSTFRALLRSLADFSGPSWSCIELYESDPELISMNTVDLFRWWSVHVREEWKVRCFIRSWCATLFHG